MRLSGVTKRFGDGPVVIDDISLTVADGEFVCLLGPSGSGKSTLLAILSGRNPPDAGVVQVNGEDLHANFEAIKQDIAVVPQKDVLHDSLALGTALRAALLDGAWSPVPLLVLTLWGAVAVAAALRWFRWRP